jgi:c-di-GMP-binding flagellar brake protein YcgR
VGETTFRGCLGASRRLLAVGRPAALRLVDRRSQLRVAMRRSVGIRLARNSAAGEGGYFAMGSSIDISLGGMRFETNVQMAVGDHVFVTVVLEQNRPLHALAQVVRLDDPVTHRTVRVRSAPALWHDGQTIVRAAVTWEAMCPADRARLQSFLLSMERAASS